MSDNTKNQAKQAAGAAKQTAEDLNKAKNAASGAAANAAQDAKNAASSAYNTAKSAVNDAASAAKNAASSSTVQSAKETVVNAASAAKETVANAAHSAQHAKETVQNAATAAKNVIGASNAVESVKAAVPRRSLFTSPLFILGTLGLVGAGYFYTQNSTTPKPVVVHKEVHRVDKGENAKGVAADSKSAEKKLADDKGKSLNKEK
eukprot:TRINITY_DN1303_c0_g1_i1.p1 TRINITY_DN1303_c0_g1~~TRINITY_DN1303_c0_g1_i1.p1  ORF type:complete len:205 (+),score=67.18 TRINITY_DN1303_c0_g1_i1:138-752(+)